VDCSGGNDASAGTSQDTAWKNVSRAVSAKLNPGDQLLLKRGCTWSQQLSAHWNGTASSPIVIGAYGSGDLPMLQNSTDGNVRISGSYLTIEDLQTSNTPNSYGSFDPQCPSQPVGWVVGFNFVTANHVTVENSVATHEAIGVAFNVNATNNHVLNNQLINNDGAWEPIAKTLRGGTGVLLEGTENEIGGNLFEGNSTHCNAESNSVELYTASNSNIHDNTSLGDKVFLEAGSITSFQSSNNTIAYNLHSTGVANSRFVVTRGAGAQFGPVWNTTVLNNTVYDTGEDAQGVICSSCGTNVLRMENNIIDVATKALYVGGSSMIESNDIFWSPKGQPPRNNFVQNWKMSGTSKTVDPAFADPSTNDFHLLSSSPANGAGSVDSITAGYTADLDGNTVPQNGPVDIGAYQAGDRQAQSTPTPTPSPTSSPTATETPSPTSTPSPISAQGASIPGRIQAEDYNTGGEGVGYHDTTSGNAGAAYRADDVDIQPCTDPTTPSGQACFNVGWPAAGEWLAYDINVTAAGNYQIVARMASIYGNRSFHIEVDGQNVTGSITVPNTGGWQSWTNVTSPSFALSAGNHTVKIVEESNGFNLNYFDVVASP
jgi:hypothetical protein